MVTVWPLRRAPVAVEVKLIVQAARALTVSAVGVVETAVTVVAATMVAAPATAVVSALVVTVGLAAPVALGLTMPAIVSEAAVEAGRLQLPPLSLRVTVTTWRLTPAAPEQLRKPLT